MSTNSTVPARSRASLASLLADAGLALVTLIWGLTFVVVKDAVAQVPVMTFLAWRFGVGAAALLPLSLRGLRRAGRREWIAGALIGVSLFAGYVLQTAGLQWTTASKTGFITGLYVPLVPLFAWPLMRERPSRNAIVGLVLATVGLALLSLRGDLRVEKGDLLVLGCAVAFAWQVVLIAYFAPRMPALTLAQVQITVVAVASAVVAALAGEPLVPLPRAVWGAVAFNGVLATSVALGLQNWLQGKTSATHAALIFVLEPVFAAMFGWVLAGETLDLRGWVGSAMILAGMIVGQRNNRSGAASENREDSRATSREL
ncbi:MAG: DMT family transporter [Anaerolineales bacterium]